jgi:hypothetical protein
LSWPGSDDCDDVNIDYKDGDETIIEYRDPLNKYVADVALINVGKVRYIFEIKHTHATITDVRPEPWYEFTTENIFQAENDLNNLNSDINLNKTVYLSCVRQSINHYCSRCIKDIERTKLISAENERYKIELEKKREQEQIVKDNLIKRKKMEDELIRKEARSRISSCRNCGPINYCTECKSKFIEIYNELKSNSKDDFNSKVINNNEILENIPILIYRVGIDNGWKQERNCVECGTKSYSPVYENRKNYAVCKICFDIHKESILSKIKKGDISNKQECLIMDD